MSAIIHIAPNGTIQLPPEILAHLQLNTPYAVRTENSKVVMEPAPVERHSNNHLSPEQRAKRFRQWVDSMPKREGPPIPDEALRRENMYD